MRHQSCADARLGGAESGRQTPEDDDAHHDRLPAPPGETARKREAADATAHFTRRAAGQHLAEVGARKRRGDRD